MLGGADVEIGIQWFSNVLGEKLTQCAARDAANDFADQMPLSDGMVATGCSWRPPGRLFCE